MFITSSSSPTSTVRRRGSSARQRDDVWRVFAGFLACLIQGDRATDESEQSEHSENGRRERREAQPAVAPRDAVRRRSVASGFDVGHDRGLSAIPIQK